MVAHSEPRLASAVPVRRISGADRLEIEIGLSQTRNLLVDIPVETKTAAEAGGDAPVTETLIQPDRCREAIGPGQSKFAGMGNVAASQFLPFEDGKGYAEPPQDDLTAILGVPPVVSDQTGPLGVEPFQSSRLHPDRGRPGQTARLTCQPAQQAMEQ